MFGSSLPSALGSHDRVPIGASNYAAEWYSCGEADGEVLVAANPFAEARGFSFAAGDRGFAVGLGPFSLNTFVLGARGGR